MADPENHWREGGDPKIFGIVELFYLIIHPKVFQNFSLRDSKIFQIVELFFALMSKNSVKRLFFSTFFPAGRGC